MAVQKPAIPPHIIASDYRKIGPPLRPEADGLRVDGFLAKEFPFYGRALWKKACAAGHLLINGTPCRASHRLRGGDQIAIYRPADGEPEVDDRVEELACSGGILALYKPGNLPMHEGGPFRRNTFAAVVAERFGAQWHPVHRLDRETSGVVICAGTPELRHKLCLAFETRRVHKRYLAICQGRTDWDSITVDQPLLLDPQSERPRYHVRPDGAKSRTAFTVLERSRDATLIEAVPLSGRTNQIRVHLDWCGHPLVGDKLYHLNPEVYPAYHRFGDTPAVRALAGFSRHALHATSIGLQHPESGREFSVESVLPEDLTRLWFRLIDAQVVAAHGSSELP